MANPVKQFKYTYELSAGSTPDTYVIGKRHGGGPFEASAFDVSDVSDGLDDDPTKLGDISGDTFDEHLVATPPFDFQGTFVGEWQDGQSFVGNVHSTLFGDSFILFSNNEKFAQGTSITVSSTPFDLVCFASGTRIMTSSGDKPVEQLGVGDLVVTVAGDARPIRWLGHRTIGCLPRRRELLPIRIAAHAFGIGLPSRDLYLSPGHPVLVGADADGEGGHLVPIMCLINGTTIERMPVDRVTYWHVELDEHDILLAEGLPAESYINLGSRAWFAGADGALYDPDMALPSMPGRCRPVALDGAVVETERRRLDMLFATRLAAAAAWPVTVDELAL